MDEEIKEILDYLDYGVNSLSISKPPFKIGYDDIKKLLDYITNLQQENERLKNIPIMDFTSDVYQELEDYKSRIDKAIEYIEKTQEGYVSELKLLDILRGEDKFKELEDV